MRVVITGGAGFIGSHVVDRLQADGHEAHVIDNLRTGRRENLPPETPLYELDIRSPEAARKVRDLQPDGVVHLAAQMDVRHSVDDPAYDAEVNILGGLNILRASGKCRFVFASTGGAIYGEPESCPVGESTPCLPLSPYGASKLAFEAYLRLFRELQGVSSTTLRLANVYGPRQDPKGEAGVVAIFSLKLLSGEPCTILRRRDQDP